MGEGKASKWCKLNKWLGLMEFNLFIVANGVEAKFSNLHDVWKFTIEEIVFVFFFLFSLLFAGTNPPLLLAVCYVIVFNINDLRFKGFTSTEAENLWV